MLKNVSVRIINFFRFQRKIKKALKCGDYEKKNFRNSRKCDANCT